MIKRIIIIIELWIKWRKRGKNQSPPSKEFREKSQHEEKDHVSKEE